MPGGQWRLRGGCRLQGRVVGAEATEGVKALSTQENTIDDVLL